MQFNWQVPPLGHQVELRLGGGGREEVIVDGFSVSTSFSNDPRSEHLLPIEGVDVRIIISRNGVVPSVELTVDGLPLAAEPSAPPAPPRVTYVAAPASAPTPPQQMSFASLLVMGFAGLGGVLASRFFGAMLFIPTLVGIGAFGILKRNVHGPGAPYITAAALIWGHLCWIAVGIFVVGKDAWLEWVILFGLGGAAALLLARPSWTLAALLVAAEGYLLYANVEIYRETGGSQMRAAIALHVILRLAAIVALMVGAWSSRSGEEAVPQPEGPPFIPEPPVAISRPPTAAARTSAPPPPPPIRPPPRSRPAPVASASRPASQRWSVNSKLAPGIVIGLVSAVAVFAGLYRPRSSSKPVVITGSTVKGSVLLAQRDEFHRVTVTVGEQRVELDERGHFVARDVPQGTHQIRVSELATLEGEASAEVVVSGEPEEEVLAPSLSLTPVAKVKGRLLIEDAFGGPARPVRGARLMVASTRLETRTDAQGGFELEVPPGPAQFQAVVEGHPPLEKQLELRWAPALLDFPTLPPVTNTRCTPSAARQGEGSRDLVGAGQPKPDGKGDYVLRLVPCRDGVIQRIQVLERAETWTRWDSTPGLYGALGVAAQRTPDTTLNDGVQLAVPVSTGDVLAIHLARKPAPNAELELLLEYDDQSVDRVPLPPPVSAHDPF